MALQFAIFDSDYMFLKHALVIICLVRWVKAPFYGNHTQLTVCLILLLTKYLGVLGNTIVFCGWWNLTGSTCIESNASRMLNSETMQQLCMLIFLSLIVAV